MPFRSRSSSRGLLPLIWLLPVLLIHFGGTSVAAPQQEQAVADLAEAEQAVAEGKALERQETADSLRQAVEKFRTAVDRFHTHERTRREARTLLDLGEVYEALGDPVSAMASDSRALELWREI